MITYSIIQKSQLEGAHRLDAEYYQPEYFIDFSKGNWESIGDCVSLCQYGLSKAMNEEKIGYPIFKMDDIDYGFLFGDKTKSVEIPDNIFRDYALEKNDVLFNRVNSEEFVGRTGIFKLDGKSVFASYLVRLKVKKNSGILPDYLNIFLNSSFGKKQIRRYSRRAVNQANVNAQELRQFKIAILPLSFQNEVKELSDAAWKNFEGSKFLYSQAEDLFLEGLGLKDFEADEDLSCIVNLSDIQKASRLDAEYFQPRYERLLDKIKNKKPKILENFVANYSTGFPFKSQNYQEEGVPLIRINNIKKGYIDLSNTAYLSEQDYLLSLKDAAKPGDIILSMSGTIGMSAIIPEDIPKCSVNQRILKFSPKNIDKDYLALLLNSIVGVYQLERIGTGGVQTNISYKDIKNILIPTLPQPTQQKIANLVRESHQARKKAKELLEEAKRKVEEMIEREGDK
ncbi:restriction endonuclease subunit S [Candidatus Falkowbacteria bacterium]|nr:restriction endonuclease subunit S [Candidatus Falkowbacteria bacterium]